MNIVSRGGGKNAW